MEIACSFLIPAALFISLVNSLHSIIFSTLFPTLLSGLALSMHLYHDRFVGSHRSPPLWKVPGAASAASAAPPKRSARPAGLTAHCGPRNRTQAGQAGQAGQAEQVGHQRRRGTGSGKKGVESKQKAVHYWCTSACDEWGEEGGGRRESGGGQAHRCSSACGRRSRRPVEERRQPS